MLSEIEVDGLGTMRQLNNFQIVRARRIADKRNRAIAFPAFGLGMTVRQFKALSADQQRAAWDAHNRLHAPANASRGATAPAGLQPPRRYERVSEERAVQLGAELVRIRAKLPHGHFQRWIEDKSGITYRQAQRFIRAAAESMTKMS